MRNFNSLPEKTLPPWLSEPSPQGSGKQRAAGLAGSSLLEAARPILRRRRKSLKQNTQTGSKRRTGGQILVDQLIAQGVERLTCVPGESYLAVLDALHDAKLDVLVCRNERGAAMMVEAYGKLTGRPGSGVGA